MNGAGSPGRLWVVATPIGNLEDVTLRALRVLREADTVLAEDTRRSRKLLSAHGIGTPLRALHAHSSDAVVDRWVAALAGGARLALVSDAGTPIVSDPGAALVARAVDAGVPVEAVPGASAVTAALVVAGLPADVFRFVGFLPRGGARRRRALDEVAGERGATVLFEAPGRVAGTLADLAARLGAGRRVAVCRELTKLHEEVFRGSLADAAARFADGARGEVTLVVEGGTDPRAEEAAAPPDAAALAAWVRERLAAGATPKAVAAELAPRLGVSKRDAYARVVGATRGAEEA